MGTTNYRNTFISVAEDCPVTAAQAPPLDAEKPTVAALQYALLAEHPYVYTSDEVLFAVHARRMNIPDERLDEERERFFAKDQACLRASPLGKRYGWGTHHDAEARVALVPLGSPEYEELAATKELAHKAAMRSSRVK